MPSLFQSFGLGSGSAGSDPGSSGPSSQIERKDKRITPPLSLVRAEIELENSRLFVGQLWDISLSGASLSLGRVQFSDPHDRRVLLRLRSRHSPDMLELPATIRWIDVNHGVTFTGLSLQHRLQPGTFLDTFLEFSEDPLLSFQPRTVS